jgi:hypothetical protein
VGRRLCERDERRAEGWQRGSLRQRRQRVRTRLQLAAAQRGGSLCALVSILLLPRDNVLPPAPAGRWSTAGTDAADT